MDLLQEKYLVDRFNQGDPEAFKVIFTTQRPILLRNIQRFDLSRETAEDIASDSLIKLWEARGHFESMGNIAGYLNRIAANASIDYLRHQAVVTDNVDQIRVLFENPPVEDGPDVIKDYLKGLIYAEIEKLPRKMRAIFKLFFVEGFNNQQIARKLNINEKTVRNKKNIALTKIRKIFNATKNPGS